MGLLDNFEQHMANILEGKPNLSGGLAISFKKLGKKAASALKKGQFDCDGDKCVPALITYLISPKDNALMARVYPELSEELANYLEQELESKGFEFSSKPLVRFVIDDSLKQGKFDVVVEEVPQVIMAHLRKEEDAFLHGRPLPKPASSSRVNYEMDEESSSNLSLSMPLAPLSEQLETLTTLDQYYIINKSTLESYQLHKPLTTIGRDSSESNIAILDANISRKHAQFEYQEDGWHLIDLNSTNGTFVNGQDVSDRLLQSGDHIVLGITEFEYRED